MKPHYFTQDKADEDDLILNMAKRQGYIPNTCLLGGQLVWHLSTAGKDPCKGCACPRDKCHGRTE